MKTILVFAAITAFAASAYAGGSIDWSEVRVRLTKDCPDLLAAIKESYDVKDVGGALRLGPQSIDVIEHRAEVGTRVPPYTFDCKTKSHEGDYNLTIEINEDDRGWAYTIRPIPKPDQIRQNATAKP